jgi:predicted signal transduction protein with EAL and GGDEF domain
MSKKTHLLHYVIQGALIVLSVAALLLLRQLLIHTEDIRAVFVYADIVLMVFVVSSVILVCIGFNVRKENGRTHRPQTMTTARRTTAGSITHGAFKQGSGDRTDRRYLKTAAPGELTLFIIDQDNFKDINVNFGHFEGDKVLKLLASKLGRVRTDDTSACSRRRIHRADEDSPAGTRTEKSRRAAVGTGVFGQR